MAIGLTIKSLEGGDATAEFIAGLGSVTVLPHRELDRRPGIGEQPGSV
jgi:hypothetical protein